MSAGPAGVAGRAWWGDGLLAAGVLSCGVADGCDQEFQVPVVQAGNGLAEGDEGTVGDAGGEGEDALFPAAEGDLPVMQGGERRVPVDPGQQGGAVADAGAGVHEAGEV